MAEAREVINATMRDHVCDQRESKCCADAILSALHDAGLKVVGREPTEAMVAGMRDAWDYFDANDDVFRREWQGAFDAAAPTKEK